MLRAAGDFVTFKGSDGPHTTGLKQLLSGMFSSTHHATGQNSYDVFSLSSSWCLYIARSSMMRSAILSLSYRACSLSSGSVCVATDRALPARKDGGDVETVGGGREEWLENADETGLALKRNEGDRSLDTTRPSRTARHRSESASKITGFSPLGILVLTFRPAGQLRATGSLYTVRTRRPGPLERHFAESNWRWRWRWRWRSRSFRPHEEREDAAVGIEPVVVSGVDVPWPSLTFRPELMVPHQTLDLFC